MVAYQPLEGTVHPRMDFTSPVTTRTDAIVTPISGELYTLYSGTGKNFTEASSVQVVLWENLPDLFACMGMDWATLNSRASNFSLTLMTRAFSSVQLQALNRRRGDRDRESVEKLRGILVLSVNHLVSSLGLQHLFRRSASSTFHHHTHAHTHTHTHTHDTHTHTQLPHHL